MRKFSEFYVICSADEILTAPLLVTVAIARVHTLRINKSKKRTYISGKRVRVNMYVLPKNLRTMRKPRQVEEDGIQNPVNRVTTLSSPDVGTGQSVSEANVFVFFVRKVPPL